MGCVFSKEISSSGPLSSEIIVDKRQNRYSGLHIHFGRSEVNTDSDGAIGCCGEAQNAVDQKREKNSGARPRGKRRRSKPNPRPSNPPKNIYGEQVIVGYPTWLFVVVGEAINAGHPKGLIPMIKSTM
ncbi:hypothetical protein L2E82_30673 [Cichorium intybus]|uniref:Uncharacterized protein n=1 Tax=Cichorium intybus TaxID=13427 RepID=A0ACB9D1C0_CICIN|nr:hypothetical protein L2E82_30673 [Cichorium intybus]